MARTIRHMRLPQEMRDRIIRLTPAQQAMTPAEALQSLILENPGVQVWFVEGLDLWSRNMVKMEVLGPEIDALQRIATKHNVCILATVGSPKMKGDDRYFGRDALYGSSVFARKVETVMLISLTNRENADSARLYDIYPRNGRMEKMYMAWEPSKGLVVTEKPSEPEPERKLCPRQWRTWHAIASTNSSREMLWSIRGTWGLKGHSAAGVMTQWKPAKSPISVASTTWPHRATAW